MLVHVEIAHMSLKNLFNILFQSKERPAKTKCVPAKLRAVLVNFGFSRNIRKYFENQHMDPRFPGDGNVQNKNKNSLTPCNVILCGVTYFANIFAKTNLSAKPFQRVYQGPRWLGFIKNAKTSRDTVTLNQLHVQCRESKKVSKRFQF